MKNQKKKKTVDFKNNHKSLNINQNSFVTLSHNIIPLNPAIHSLSSNNNRENQGYLSTIDYDEYLPSYDDVVNN